MKQYLIELNWKHKGTEQISARYPMESKSINERIESIRLHGDKIETANVCEVKSVLTNDGRVIFDVIGSIKI